MGEAQPPKDWPGLEAERDGVTYDARKIANIAEALREAMQPISGYGTSKGSVGNLATSGDLSKLRDHLAGIDRVDGIKTFLQTLTDNHETFTQVYGRVLQKFETAITLIDDGAGTYRVTNTANEGGR
ncbi:hypothetical protein [Nonomuraea sp. SYSU D8015]|uniref:hypothetical protein n=1 Tax=Nonomuraea sp. SYSU D8015 TaxID=2593644 RepID=UPI0016605D95|nr:hypothetical protein [Nonomuraea sp. SYSU D8015]